MKRAYDLVIFDCDGTLVDSEPLTNRLIAEMINELNISIDTKTCLGLFAGKTIGHITTFIKEQGVSIDDKKFEVSYRERCFALFNDELKPISGVGDLLKGLTVPYCVASNAPKRKMEITLPATGLAKYFSEDRIFSAYDVQQWKPEPALFLYAAQKMNVHPSRCLVIEDTWSGAMGAVNAQIDVLGYNPHGDWQLYIDGVPNFTKMKDIQNYLL
jgi:HAD superfamily hydrolase (TIGR01509 family)